MTILSMLQELSYEVGLRTPATIIGNSDPDVLQLLQLTYREAKELRMAHEFPQLQKEYTFTTTSGTASYALPADFTRFLFSTQWDRTNHWQLLGPLSPQEWQVYKSGIIADGPRRRFRVKGYSDTQFFIDPTPSTTGDTLVFEYLSSSWLRPVVWTTSTVFAAAKYCSYNGNIYYTTAGGTTGATPPTHTSGSVSDGGVTWTYTNQLYETATADTDFAVISERVIQLGVQWRYKRAKGLSYDDIKLEQRYALEQEFVAYQGARRLSMSSNWGYRFLDWRNIPDTGYGS